MVGFGQVMWPLWLLVESSLWLGGQAEPGIGLEKMDLVGLSDGLGVEQ